MFSLLFSVQSEQIRKQKCLNGPIYSLSLAKRGSIFHVGSKCQSDYDVDVYDVDSYDVHHIYHNAHFGIFPFCHAPTGDIIMQKYPKMAIWP